MALSFKNVDGENIHFDNRNELYLEEQNDVVTGEITAYLVTYNEHVYEVTEETYNALSDL